MEKVVVQLTTGMEHAEVYGTVYVTCDSPWGREYYQWSISGELPDICLSSRSALRAWATGGLMPMAQWFDVDGWRRIL